MIKEFRLTKQDAQYLAAKYETPLHVVSLAKVEENYRFFQEHLPRVKIFYALKSNPFNPIAEKVNALGGCFDVASEGEIMQLHELGIPAAKMVYANPYKTPKGMAAAEAVGLRYVTLDSQSEVDKLAAQLKGASVLVRIRIDNPRALVDLNKKFGVAPDEALELLKYSRTKGLEPAGICFHVGSQSPSPEAHIRALKVSRELFDKAADCGIKLRLLDIGGGFPLSTADAHIDIGAFMDAINSQIDEIFPDTEIWAEPGRYICGTAVNLLTSVIGTSVRRGQPWYFLDDGIYNSFSSVIYEHWNYEFVTFKDEPQQLVTFAGPSCDSLDVLSRSKLSEKLAFGDIVMIPNCGAYSYALTTGFNGFARPHIIVWDYEGQDS